MSELKYKPIPKRLYQYNPSNYCGVFMPEKVMKKLVKLTAAFESEVKKILTDNEDDLYEMHWTLAYPNGEQTTVLYATKSKEGIKRRINLFKPRQPEYKAEVYEINDYSKEIDTLKKQIEETAQEQKQ